MRRLHPRIQTITFEIVSDMRSFDHGLTCVCIMCLILNRNNETISNFPRLDVWQLYKLGLFKCHARLTKVKFLIGNDSSNKFVCDNVHKILIIFCNHVPIIHYIPSIILPVSRLLPRRQVYLYLITYLIIFLILIGWEFLYMLTVIMTRQYNIIWYDLIRKYWYVEYNFPLSLLLAKTITAWFVFSFW